MARRYLIHGRVRVCTQVPDWRRGDAVHAGRPNYFRGKNVTKQGKFAKSYAKELLKIARIVFALRIFRKTLPQGF
jgi:hypothetical protein